MIRWWSVAAVTAAAAMAASPAEAQNKARPGARPAAAPVGVGAGEVKAGVDAWGRGDYARAVEAWRPLALRGDADAQFNLGQAYKLGRGVPLDQAAARGWFLKAANQGHLQAADNYGLSLFENNQRAEAVPWLEKSVARGEPRAELVYGTMLFNGDGVGRDYPRAYALVSRAAEDRVTASGASTTLAQMDQYLTPEDRRRGAELTQRYAADQTARRVAENGGRTAVPLAPPPSPTPAPDRGSPPPRIVDRSSPPPPVDRTPPPRAIVARPAPRPAPAPVAGGRWRVQLGAFRDAGNARSLWARVGGRVGGTASYVAGGGVTRLQAGPFASRAAAERACSAAGGGCVVVGP